jgi:hypothetical protein
MLPVVLSGVAAGWPAIQRWRDVSYLHATAGNALVEVEVGSSFLDPQMQQQRCTLSDFICMHMRVSGLCLS